MRDYSFVEGKGGTFLSNFSSRGLNENISFVDNIYSHLIHLGQNVRGATFRNMYMESNRGGATWEILIHTLQDLTMENVESVGGTFSTFMVIQPRPLGGPETSDASNIVLRNLRVTGELGRRFSAGPSAAIWVDVNDAGNDTESIDGLRIEDAHFNGNGPNQCGIWLEDNHSPGPVQPLMEESRTTMVFANIFVTGTSGHASAVCTGNTDGPPHDDTTSSAAPFTQTYGPTPRTCCACWDCGRGVAPDQH